jgi:hypothetical protein
MIRTSRPAALAMVVSLTACASYVLPVPADLTPGATLAVQGASGFNQRSMTVGDYAVRIDRGSTQERSTTVAPVSNARKRQNYSFVITRTDSTVFSGGCSLSAKATNVGIPGGVQVSASEVAELDCELLPKGRGRESWRLTLSGDTDDPLNGQLVGTSTYTLQGVGTALGSTRHGPTGGYYIKQDDRTVASVQTTGPRQVIFAPQAMTDELIAAATVLLLIDESVRELD